MSEFLFYHLTESRLEEALPALLEKTMQRGWKAVVEATSEERVASLNAHLWTYTEDSFLPHGAASDGHAEHQLIYLTADSANPNSANVRFLVDGAMPNDTSGYERICLMFDGHDNMQLADARAAWKRLKTDGATMTYWAQTQDGRWEKKA
jgi:DNA polymerase III subunit chi